MAVGVLKSSREMAPCFFRVFQGLLGAPLVWLIIQPY